MQVNRHLAQAQEQGPTNSHARFENLSNIMKHVDATQEYKEYEKSNIFQVVYPVSIKISLEH